MMKVLMKLQATAATVALIASVHASAAESTLFSERAAYYQTTGARIVDGFENPDYRGVMSDAAMSAVVGESQYFTYGGDVVDYNNVLPSFGVGGSYSYCSLCYGSFRLSFETTSLTNEGGVYGVGVDIMENSAGGDLPYTYSATVTFVDGSTEIFGLPYVVNNFPLPSDYRFWGITAETGIRSVDFVSYSYSGPDRTYLIIDNLTISAAPIPEYSAFGLMLAGLGLLGVAARGRKIGVGKITGR